MAVDAQLCEDLGVRFNVGAAPKEHGDIAEFRGPCDLEVGIEYKSVPRPAERRDAIRDQFRFQVA